MPRYLCLLPIPFLLTGCLPGFGRCTYETRNLDFEAPLTGTVHQEPDSGNAVLSLSESKGSHDLRTLTVSVQTFLAGAIAEVRILDTRGGSDRILANFSGTGNQGIWYGYQDLTSSQPSAWLLARLEESGHLEIVATVATGTGGVLRGRLNLVFETGWERPYCS